MKYDKEERQKQFEAWSDKSKEWLMQRLWESRKKWHETMTTQYIINADWELRIINDGLAKVLHDNGIRPRRYLIQYEEKKCAECPFEYECFGEDDNDECYVTITSELTLYGIHIDAEGLVTGINSRYKHISLNALKVIDADTNEVLYRYEEEKNDSSRAEKGTRIL